MKSYLTFFIVLLLSINCAAKIEPEQDGRNLEYLQILDQNINGTIKILTAFNDNLDKIPTDITGTNTFSQFLMELTLECSNLKKQILESNELNANEREELIKLLVSTLHPDINWFPYVINQDKDEQNKQIALIMRRRIKEHIITTQKKIFEEEKGILESKTFHKYFFSLHSQHFMYQLLMDFLEPSDKLSKDNRDYLIKVVRAVEDDMMSNSAAENGGEQ